MGWNHQLEIVDFWTRLDRSWLSNDIFPEKMECIPMKCENPEVAYEMVNLWQPYKMKQPHVPKQSKGMQWSY